MIENEKNIEIENSYIHETFNYDSMIEKENC